MLAIIRREKALQTRLFSLIFLIKNKNRINNITYLIVFFLVIFLRSEARPILLIA